MITFDGGKEMRTSMTDDSNRAPAAPDLPDAASAAEYIEKLAADYLRDHASTEHDTGAVAFHYGEAGRDYHSTLVELAEDLRSHVKPAPAEPAPVPASTGRNDIGWKMANWLFGLSVSELTPDAWRATCAELSAAWHAAPVAARELDADAELPPLPDGDEYSATRILPNGELAPRFKAATMRADARTAIAADRATRATAESAPASAAPRYRLLDPRDMIEAKDEWLSNDTATWAVNPSRLFDGCHYVQWMLPARRRVADSPVGAKEKDK